MTSSRAGKVTYVAASEAGADRARELVASLRAVGHDVRQAVLAPAAAGEGDGERLHAELEFCLDLARRVLEDEGALLLADERPALAVPEMLRILIDERGLGWGDAWRRVRQATRGRLASPRNESSRPLWPVALLESERPRLLEILFEINRRHLDEVEAAWPGDGERRRRLSLFREGERRRLRPSLLALVAAGGVDVATPWDGPTADALADLLVLRPHDLHGLPTPVFARGWLEQNPALAELLTASLGAGYPADPEALEALQRLAFDGGFRDRFRQVRRANRERLAPVLRERCGVEIDPDSLVEVRLGRLEPRERPLLNALGLVREHLRITAGGWTPPAARTVVLGRVAEAANQAPLIELLTALADSINRDPRSRSALRVAVLPDCDLETERLLAAAADLSNQPGPAGSGAAGASALGFAVNGAVTLGTRDGTVRELEQVLGAEGLFLFGLGPLDTRAWRAGRIYRPQDVYVIDPLVRLSLDALVSPRYLKDPGAFQWARQQLLDPNDPWLTLADLGSYLHRQDEVLAEFQDTRAFAEKAILTLAGARRFWENTPRRA